MNKFKDMSVSVRHVVTAAWIAVPLVAGMSVGAFRLSAVEEDAGELVETVQQLVIEQAVMNTKLDSMEKSQGKDKEEILVYLRRIEDKVDRR